MVDAHNSLGLTTELANHGGPEWLHLIQQIKPTSPEGFRIGFAHSKETGMQPAGDLTENGIALIVFEVNNLKWVLALADANNAVPGMREAVSTALDSAGFRLLEFCTSDSHDLSARGLTVNRGYKALGEATPTWSIAKATVGLAKVAESRLAGCTYASGTFRSEARLFGASALKEFAAITRTSSTFAKRYALLAVPCLIVLMSLAVAV